MSKLFKISTLSLIALATVTVFALGTTNTVSAQDGENKSVEVMTTSENTEVNAGSTYEYVAQPGDSFTKIARKAVQTYGAVKQVNLSQAQIIAAETFLTKAAGSPELNVGEKVMIKESDVEAAVKKAQALNESQIALWQKYVAGVNFNTDKVGQA